MPHFFTKPVVFAMLLTGVLLAASCTEKSDNADFLLEDGWVRAMPPGSNMTAAYGRFSYHGATTIEIASFRSDSYGDVSFHQTTIENGISRMNPAVWTQEPGSTLVLEPGGYHLMLMEPTRETQPGEFVNLTLIAREGQEFTFSLPVVAR